MLVFALCLYYARYMSENYTNDIATKSDPAYYGPHEIHITVKPSNTSTSRFAQLCNQIGAKAQIIHNARPKLSSLTNYITVSYLKKHLTFTNRKTLNGISHL